MLVTLKEIMEIAQREEKAIGAFDCTGLETVMAIIEAAEELERPVIIQFAELHEGVIPFKIIAPIMLQLAEDAKVPVCVEYDHGESVASCKKAIDAGFTAVMYDGSALSYEENLKNTQEIVAYAHEKGASVEAELGNVFASKIGAGERSYVPEMNDVSAYTDPDMAKAFVEATNVDALAVAFGTAHGVYLEEPVLDLDRITLIREKTNVPLVMHGGSGLKKEEHQTAIKNGIRKINYYTYMVMAGGRAVADEVRKKEGEILFFPDLAEVGKNAMKENVKEAINVFALN